MCCTGETQNEPCLSPHGLFNTSAYRRRHKHNTGPSKGGLTQEYDLKYDFHNIIHCESKCLFIACSTFTYATLDLDLVVMHQVVQHILACMVQQRCQYFDGKTVLCIYQVKYSVTRIAKTKPVNSRGHPWYWKEEFEPLISFDYN